MHATNFAMCVTLDVLYTGNVWLRTAEEGARRVGSEQRLHFESHQPDHAWLNTPEDQLYLA